MSGVVDLPDEVRARLEALVTGAPGRLRLAVRLDDGRRLDVDAGHVVPSASTIKVPVLVAALRACQEGRLDLEAPLALPAPDERVGGSGPVELLPSVSALPLGEVLLLMICLSDNDATNAVIDAVGTDAVAASLALVPTRDTVLQRRLMDFAAAERGLQNLTTAADLADLLVALHTGRLLDAAHTEVARGILRRQQFREGLPGYLPETLPVASKTGSIFGVRADMALVESPDVGGRWATVAVVATGLGEGEVDRGTAVLPVFAAIGEAVAGLL